LQFDGIAVELHRTACRKPLEIETLWIHPEIHFPKRREMDLTRLQMGLKFSAPVGRCLVDIMSPNRF
jgi:hypothetical protein